MYNLNETLRAIGRVMARYAQDHVGDFDTNGVIESAPLLNTWKSGTTENPIEYKTGDVRSYANQPWKCNMDHTHHGEDGWDPLTSRTLWSPYHSKRFEYALPYVQPTGAHDAYNEGEWMVWVDGRYFRCKNNGTVHTPEQYPQAWEEYIQA